MSEAIVVALISGGITALCTLITVRASNEKLLLDLKAEIQTQQAVQDEKISELTREVRTHNEFAVRVPVLEERIRQMTKGE
jgi:hypothetical protein